MKSMLAAVLVSVCAAFPLVAAADTSPLVNRVIVNQALQQQMQNQLQTQQTQIQTQQDLMRLNLQNGVDQQNTRLQYLLLQQQLELLRIEQRERARSSFSHRRHPHV